MVLDKLNPTVDLELLSVEPIVQALLQKPRDTEIIITGRCHKPHADHDLASVHSEVYCHKHYGDRGVEFKRGLDF
ncbi:cob(I)yrinic acid a,c-diamide adenosyltransferase [Microcoleus sp.]|uniref:cob(I)yrinic acid a,c-diamide adenosyltransferase n=1 Tax=Microcoleus sp. TaxID=44472 RepID=UPI003593C7E8